MDRGCGVGRQARGDADRAEERLAEEGCFSQTYAGHSAQKTDKANNRLELFCRFRRNPYL